MTKTLLRQHIGVVLRAERAAQGRTLRDVASGACVSLGYLSEVERGEKEPSSETLAAVCASLGVPMSILLMTLAGRCAAVEDQATAPSVPGGSVVCAVVLGPAAELVGRVNPPWGEPVPAVVLRERVARYQARNVAAHRSQEAA